MPSLQNPPFSASSSWNTPVAADANYSKLNWPGSTGYNYSVAWDSYSPAVYVASSSDPVVQVSHPASWGYPAGTVSVHMPAAADGADGTDGELVVIDGDMAYNFWQFNRTSGTTATAASLGMENVASGDGWGSKSPFRSAGITAAGASELAGLLVKSETDDGSIDHALQIAIDSKLARAGFTGAAIAGDGGSSSGIVQEGQHLAISPDTPMPSGLSALGRQVFTAMQKYGAYVVDVAGGTTNIRAQENDFDPTTITALWHDMGKITPLLQSVSGGTQVAGGTGSTDGAGTSTGSDPRDPGGVTSGGGRGAGSTGGSSASNGSDPTDGTGVTQGQGTHDGSGSTSGSSTSNSSDPTDGTGVTQGRGTHDGSGSTGGTSASGGSDPTTGTGVTHGGGATSGGSDHDSNPRWGRGDHHADSNFGGRSLADFRSGVRDFVDHVQNGRGLADLSSGTRNCLNDFLGGRNHSLGFSDDSHNTGGLSGMNGLSARGIALLNQYAAGSFARTGEALGRTQDHASASLAQALARPHA